jgi:peptidoglycan/LPS O-acetylase OafA/YrhL
MIVALRSGGMRRLVGVAVGVTVVSAVLPVLLWRGADSIPRLYYAPDTRAVQLLVGCLLALALQAAPLRRRIERWSRWCAPAALIALLAFVVFGSWRSPGTYLGGMTAVALLAAAVVASAATSSPGRPAGSGPVARLLSFVPLVALGRISYGLYLWHWPVYLVLNGAFLQMSFWPTQLVRVAVSVALAIASYGVVERPFLRLQRLVRPSTRPQVLVAPKQLVAPNP